jgi:CRISPR/Cas system type I-B associated protein Csh2 (Cas7 group RAMP superfamily)
MAAQMRDDHPVAHRRQQGCYIDEAVMNLVEASGLTADEFSKVQKAIVTLRNNLIKAAQGKG